MTTALGGILDVSLAWNITKDELRRAKVREPFELEIVRRNSDQWLADLAAELDESHFSPEAMEVVEAPKSRGIVRPLAKLRLADRVVYTAAVVACFDAIRREVTWSQGTVDFANQLSTQFPDSDWIQNRFQGWNTFRRATVANIDALGGTVAFTDIAAFYENIDIATLMSDLHRVGAPRAASELISRCLDRWAQVQGRGLPQEIEASHVLAKLHLDIVDRALKNENIIHVRYNDDIRLFVGSRPAGERALVYLARLLRRRGLVLQSAKSVIEEPEQARLRAEGLAPILKTVQRKWIEDMLDFMGVDDDPYPSIVEIDDFLAENPDDAPIEIIRRAFRRYFLARDRPSFDKSLFHYLLKRLGIAQDHLAIKRVTWFLTHHPEETSELLTYIERLGAIADKEPTLARFLRSAQGSVYPHQAYQVLRWAERLEPPELPHLLPVARGYAFDQSGPRHLRAIARAIVGRYGDAADLERLREAYDTVHDPLERAQLVCALSQMETGQRNAFFARVRHDHKVVSLAVEWCTR